MTKTNHSADLIEKRSHWLKWIVLFFAILLYSNTLYHEYALDDYSIIIEHAHVQKGIDGIGAILTTNYRHGHQGFNDGLYRPLSLITFAIEQSLFNGNPSISHLINILLYGFSSLLLFLSLRRILSDQKLVIPLGICLLFIAHPLHTEVVANIKSRDELLAFFGFTLSLYSFLRMQEKKVFLVSAIIAFVIALFSKENAVIFSLFIPVLMLLDKRKSLKDIVPILLITLPLTVGFMLLRNHVIDSMEFAVDKGNFGILNNPIAATEDNNLRWGSTFALQLTFLSKLLFPYPLIHDYSYNQIPLVSLGSMQSILGILVYLGLGILSVLAILKQNRWGLIAILYLLSILVASQIFLPIGIQFAERMLFIAVLPFAMLVTFGIQQILQKKKEHFPVAKQKTLLSILAACSILYTYQTLARNNDWKNNLTLYSADIEKGAESARVNYNYGSILNEEADRTHDLALRNRMIQGSIKYLNKAVEIYPDYMDAWNNLGIVYKKAGNYSAAIQVYEQSIARDPNYSKAYFNLGTAYFQEGQYRKAINALNEYTDRIPTGADAYIIKAQAAGSLSSFPEVISYLNQYLQYRPKDASAYNMLGMAYSSLDQFFKAEKAFKKAIQLAPNNTEILFNMAINYNRNGRAEQEEKTLRKIIELQPQHRAALQQLINILELSGRSEEASSYRKRLR